MFLWYSLAFSMIQQMLATWSLVPPPFLYPVWTSRSSHFMYFWSLAWRILSIILLGYEMSATVLIVQRMFEHSLALPFFEIEASYPYLSESRQNENHNHRKLVKLIIWTTALSNSMKLWAIEWLLGKRRL